MTVFKDHLSGISSCVLRDEHTVHRKKIVLSNYFVFEAGVFLSHIPCLKVVFLGLNYAVVGNLF